MTISSEAARRTVPLLCDGVTVTFPFSFRIFATADVDVTVQAADGSVTVLTEGAGFTVSMNSDQSASPGGTITTPSAYAAGNSLVISSGVAATQSTAIPNASAFYANVVEQALDRLTTLLIDLKELAGRSVRFPVTDEDAAVALEPAALRANSVLAFDADGQPYCSTGLLGGSIAPSAFIETLLDDASAAVARATLGLDINALATLSAPASADKLRIYDASAAGDRGILLSDLRSILSLGQASYLEARLTAGLSLPDATITDVTGWTEIEDLAGEFNTTTGVWTAAAAGVYLVNWAATLGVNAGNTTESFRCDLCNNAGTVLWPGDARDNPATASMNLVSVGSATLTVAAGGTLKLRALHNTGVARSLQISNDTRLSILRVR